MLFVFYESKIEAFFDPVPEGLMKLFSILRISSFLLFKETLKSQNAGLNSFPELCFGWATSLTWALVCNFLSFIPILIIKMLSYHLDLCYPFFQRPQLSLLLPKLPQNPNYPNYSKYFSQIGI